MSLKRTDIYLDKEDWNELKRRYPNQSVASKIRELIRKHLREIENVE